MLVLFTVSVVWIFSPFLWGGKIVGFRDAVQTFWPNWEWADRVWASGEVPLWNPHDGLGRSFVADGVSAVFYPGKCIFWLRCFSFETRMGIFLAFHVWLAGLGAARLARHFQANRFGSGLAMMAYGLSGPVLFQATNAVYLVSAAWLPWGLLQVWRSRSHRTVAAGNTKPTLSERPAGWTGNLSLGRWRLTLGCPPEIFGTGIIAGMMVLGGDPQMAYLLLLIAAAVWFRRESQSNSLPNRMTGARGATRSPPNSQPRSAREENSNLQGEHNSIVSHVGRRFCATLAAGIRSAVAVSQAGLLTVAISAVQFFPTAVAAWNSERTHSEIVFNGWQWRPGKTTGFLVEPKLGTHHGDVYEFSQPPWTWLELLLPGASGQMYPIRSRWTDVLPSADRVWQPNLYQGLIPVGLALWSWPRRRLRGWWCLTVIAALGSLGWYGPIWAWNELGGLTGGWAPVRDLGRPVGGIYWLFVSGLPGFDSFRYPAKLWVVCTLGIAVAAGCSLRRRKMDRLSVPFCWLAASTVLLAAGLLWVDVSQWLPADPGDRAFGPLDRSRAEQALMLATSHAAAIALMVLIANRLLRSGKWKAHQRMTWLAITCMELLVAHSTLLPAINPPGRESSIVTQSADPPEIDPATDGAAHTSETMSSGRSQLDYPATWANAGSEDRLQQLADLQFQKAEPRLHLLRERRVFQVPATLESWDDQAMERLAIQGAERRPRPDWFSKTEMQSADRFVRIPPFPLRTVSRLDTSFKTRYKLYQDRVIETIEGQTFPSPEDTLSQEAIRSFPLSGRTSQRVWLEIELEQPAVLVLPDAYAEGWQVKIHDIDRLAGARRELCVRIAGIWRGVRLPAGNYHIEFFYRPPAIIWGAIFSTISGLLVVIIGGLRLVDRGSGRSPNRRQFIESQRIARRPFKGGC